MEVILQLYCAVNQKIIFCLFLSSQSFCILAESPPFDVLDPEQVILEWPNIMLLHRLSLPIAIYKLC